MHITSTKPARGTVIVGLRTTNTTYRRNLFVGLGLASTSNHKGYTYTGATKVIHSYLPHEVERLLMYCIILEHIAFRRQARAAHVLVAAEAKNALISLAGLKRDMGGSACFRILRRRDKTAFLSLRQSRCIDMLPLPCLACIWTMRASSETAKSLKGWAIDRRRTHGVLQTESTHEA